MVIRAWRFNTYLCLALLLAAALGCQTTTPEEKQQKKQKAVLRVHLEAAADGTPFNQPVSIGRTSPIAVNIHRNPFLTEENVAEARIIEAVGGFALQIQFDQRGTWLLEQYTGSNPRRRLAIYTQFGEDLEFARWLAAPMIYQRISNGLLTFTPDADREETEKISHGLNNYAKDHQPKPIK